MTQNFTRRMKKTKQQQKNENSKREKYPKQ